MDAERQFNEACGLLCAARFSEGWPLYEARRDRLAPTPQGGLRKIAAPAADYPEWQGEPLAGKRLMVCAEQGYGDQLMFGRYLPLLAEMGAQVVVACDVRVLGRLFMAAGFSVVPMSVARPLPEADYWTLIGSVPLRLGLPAIPRASYLPLPRSGRGGIGVMTRGRPDHRYDADRTLDPAAERAVRALGRDLSPEATGAADFLDTAAHLSGLDLVITVDTALAHLAGAVAAPCWVLLPYRGLDWRWNDGRSSVWYPTFRLFRQPRPGDWRSVVAEVSSELAQVTS